MTVESISWSISTKECCRPRRLNPRPPCLQSDDASNWATEAGPKRGNHNTKRTEKQKNKITQCKTYKYSDCHTWANIVDPDQTLQNASSGQGLHWIQSNLVISNSFISNYRLSRNENLVPVLTWNYDNRQQNNVEKRRNSSSGAISPLSHISWGKKKRKFKFFKYWKFVCSKLI